MGSETPYLLVLDNVTLPSEPASQLPGLWRAIMHYTTAVLSTPLHCTLHCTTLHCIDPESHRSTGTFKPLGILNPTL